MKSNCLKRRRHDDTLIKCHQISQSGQKHGLPFEFCVREQSGPKSAKWAPTLSFAGKTCIKVWKGVWWRHLGGFARATSRLRATFFTRSFTIQRLHYTHVPVSFRIAKMKFNSFNFFLLKLWLHALMSIAIMLHQIVLIIWLYIRGHNFMVIPNLITLHHITSHTAIP